MNTIYEPRIINRGFNSTELLEIKNVKFEKRIIMINGEINFDMAIAVVNQIQYLNSVDTTQPIILEITYSPGGAISAGNTIKDSIQLSKAPVYTYCCGLAASMAAIIFALGEKRYMYPSANLMYHDPLVSGLSGSAIMVMEKANDLMKIRDEFALLLSNITKLSKQEILEMTKTDCFIDANEALEKGFATEIVKKEID